MIFLKPKYVISFLLLGLTIFVSYLFAGILGTFTGTDLSFVDSVTEVLLNPFSNHFNGFSPIIILIGVLVFEFIWMYRNVFSTQKDVSDDKKEDSDGAEQSGENMPTPSLKNIPDPAPDVSSIDLTEFGFVIPDDIKEPEAEDEEELGFNSDDSISIGSSDDLSENTDFNDDEYKKFTTDVFWALNAEYSPEQINEMVKLFKYNRDITPDLLRNMFNPSLSSDEINEYISLFYC